MWRKVLLAALTGLLALPVSALATHPVPQSADSIHVSLVPAFRHCGTSSNPANGQHSPPLGTPSCNPPLLNNPNGARLGPLSASSIEWTALPGDLGIELTLDDVRTSTGADFNPTFGEDIRIYNRIRFSDHYNCVGCDFSGPYDEGGTGTDVDMSADINCVPTGDPTAPPGSACNVNTTMNSLIPGLFTAGKGVVLQMFRARVHDKATDPASWVLFAQQGIYIP
jgi:hypothetical protein